MKISRKTIAVLSCGMSVILIGSGALIGVSLIVNNSDDDTPEVKPMNRGDNYEHFKISQYVQNSNKLQSIISLYIVDDKYKRKINEDKFLENISLIIKDGLSNVEKFKTSIDKYKFDLSYRIGPNEDEILIDVVWYIPNSYSQYYYYDQFKITISNL